MATKSFHRKRRRYAAPIGGIFALLTVIGLIAVVIGSISLTAKVLDNSGDLKKIEQIIRPLVMFDPAPFEKAADIDEQKILEYCLWSALGNNAYTFNSNNELVVPASDLNFEAKALFGSVVLNHQTFGELEYSTYFDPDREVYTVNTTVILYTYTPYVESIERSGDLYNVRVGYVPAQGVSPLTMRESAASQPDKYMLYIMRKVGESYQIVAVRDVAEGQTHMTA